MLSTVGTACLSCARPVACLGLDLGLFDMPKEKFSLDDFGAAKVIFSSSPVMGSLTLGQLPGTSLIDPFHLPPLVSPSLPAPHLVPAPHQLVSDSKIDPLGFDIRQSILVARSDIVPP